MACRRTGYEIKWEIPVKTITVFLRQLPNNDAGGFAEDGVWGLLRKVRLLHRYAPRNNKKRVYMSWRAI
ncbi:MAG: hypothetical protein ACYS0H_30090 [Planctomycetota bacterium]